jgi:hypothetical protein
VFALLVVAPRLRVGRPVPRGVVEWPSSSKQSEDAFCLGGVGTRRAPRLEVEYIPRRLHDIPLPGRVLLSALPLLIKLPFCNPSCSPSDAEFLVDGAPLPRAPRPLERVDALPRAVPRPLEPGGVVDRPLVVPPPRGPRSGADMAANVACVHRQCTCAIRSRSMSARRMIRNVVAVPERFGGCCCLLFGGRPL